MTRRTGSLPKWLVAMTLAATFLPGRSEANDWPIEIDADGTLLVVYRPEIESLDGESISARTAVTVKRAGGATPVFGAVWFDGKVATDRQSGMVNLVDLEVSEIKLPDLDPDESDKLTQLLESEAPGWDLSISRDRLLAELDLVEQEKEASAKLNTEPPKILFVTYPAVLVVIDGEPILKGIQNSEYSYVVNTPFFLARDPGADRFYLKGGGRWYVARDLKGDWDPIDSPPRALANLAHRYVESTGIAFEEMAADSGEHPVIPRIILTTEPAELVQTAGEPEYAPIEGTSLLYMTNTDNDVIMDIDSQRYFLLLAGRWFASPSLTRDDWTFVAPDELPAGFPSIPADSDMSSVRASIAGTEEARAAVLDNAIPRMATIDRRTAALEVKYDGDPRFEEIEGTDMSYAVNTDKSVLMIDGRYYCCDDAVWFVATSPWGPWEVCVSVPSEVRTIPPSCPAYPVKYVHVYHYTPEIVYVGYTPGYLGGYVYRGCVVYGTGYPYRPWYRRCFYPRPVTYGFNVHYSTLWGWGFSYGMSTGWFRFGLGVHPRGWWGPAGYCHGYRHGYLHGRYYGHRRGYAFGRHGGPHFGFRQGYRHRHHYAHHRGYDRGSRGGYGAGHPAGPQRRRAPNIYDRRDRIWHSGVWSAGGRGRRARTESRVTADRRRPGTPDRRLGAANGRRSVRSRSRVYSVRNGNIYRRTDRGWKDRRTRAWSQAEARRVVGNRSRTRLNRGEWSRYHYGHGRGYARPEQHRQRPVERRLTPSRPGPRARGGRTRR